MCHGAHVKIRAQLVEVSSLFLTCESQESKTGHQSWQHVPLPSDLSLWPQEYLLNVIVNGLK